MPHPLHHPPRFLRGLNSTVQQQHSTNMRQSYKETEMIGNSSDKPWMVLKFGGTSVGKFIENITSIIVKGLLDTHRVAVVCSARSTDTKAHGTTNRLLRAATEALLPGSKVYMSVVDDILEDHVQAARSAIGDPDILKEIESHIQRECDDLKKFLSAAEIIDEISPRSRDMVVSVGEKLSCRLVSAVLRDRGVKSQYVSLDRVVQRQFDEKTLDQTFYNYLAEEMAKEVIECGENVPVITGFFGNVPGSLLLTVGRGYTDLAAALIAVGIQAEELQVWKEVDGIFTADPRKVSRARLLPIITPDEAAELTYYGSEVIHPFTMEQVIRAQIPIRIKNVQRPEGRGTIIFPDVSSSDNQDLPGIDVPKELERRGSNSNMPLRLRKLLSECGYHTDLSRRQPTAVTVKDSVIVLNIHSNRKSVSHGFLAKIFTTLDGHGIIVDLISTSEVHVSMVLGLGDGGASGLEKMLVDLRKLGTVDVLKDMAILSLVGKQMKNTVGISGKMFTTLAQAGINIEMISQGASEINISCVIEESAATRALNCIHDSLLITPKNLENGTVSALNGVAQLEIKRGNPNLVNGVDESDAAEAEIGYWRGYSLGAEEESKDERD